MGIDGLEALVEAFARFPGIGPRQAQRMVYYLLRQNKAWVDDLADAMRRVKAHSATCSECYRHFIPNHQERSCTLCTSSDRDNTTLMIVEKDMDLDNIERAGTFRGMYFVLGGTISALEKDPTRKIRIKELTFRVENDNLKEIIMALSATPDGDDTADYIKKTLSHLLHNKHISLSLLGRGLSTGSELEYADKETIKEAIERRR